MMGKPDATGGRHQGHRGSIVIAWLVAIGVANAAAGQDPAAAASPQARTHPVADAMKVVAGAGSAFLEHEADHVLFDLLFDAHPFVKSVQFGPVPFFAIAHRPQSPRREFVISSAGLWTQNATSEWLLTRHPHLRHEHAPFAKGSFAFDVLTSVGYGVVALFGAGPPERDTRGMSRSIGVNEGAIGVIVMAPAVLDGYRYFNPEARWATWASRLVKAGSVVLVVK